MWYIGENIINNIINLNNIMFKFFFLWFFFFDKKDYSLLKQKKHIGSLIHDFNQIALWTWTVVFINIWDIFVSSFQMTIISNHYACFDNVITPHYNSC
jgi:hypothetical protein